MRRRRGPSGRDRARLAEAGRLQASKPLSLLYDPSVSVFNPSRYAEAPKDVKPTRGHAPHRAVSAARVEALAAHPGLHHRSVVLGLVPPYLMRLIIDDAIPQKNGTELNWLVAAMISRRSCRA